MVDSFYNMLVHQSINNDDNFYIEFKTMKYEFVMSYTRKVEPFVYVKYKKYDYPKKVWGKKVYFRLIEDALQACVNYIETGIFDESKTVKNNLD